MGLPEGMILENLQVKPTKVTVYRNYLSLEDWDYVIFGDKLVS